MIHELDKKQCVALNKAMYENMEDNLQDMKRSVKKHPFGSKITYNCYLLAMMRLVIDFSTIAVTEHNDDLVRALDRMYQVIHKMLMKANSHFAFLNLSAPFSRRAQVGNIYHYVFGVHEVLLKDKPITKQNLVTKPNTETKQKGGDEH